MLTDTINMMQGADGQGESFDIAAISGIVFDSATLAADPYGVSANQKLVMTWVEGRVILSAPRWNRASWDQRLSLAQAAMAIFVCVPNAETSTLCWLFSGMDVERADADEMLSCWQEDGAPPVMSMIDFLVVDRAGYKHIRTVGLSALVGHEVEAVIGEDQAELARMVGRLAQEALRTGPVTRDDIAGPDDGKYRLKHLPGSAIDSPSIELSVENT